MRIEKKRPRKGFEKKWDTQPKDWEELEEPLPKDIRPRDEPGVGGREDGREDRADDAELQCVLHEIGRAGHLDELQERKAGRAQRREDGDSDIEGEDGDEEQEEDEYRYDEEDSVREQCPSNSRRAGVPPRGTGPRRGGERG